MPRESDYERRERLELFNTLREIQRAPLAERRENLRKLESRLASLRDPYETIAERVGWLLDGNYGYGSMLVANEIAKNPRMNRVAALTQLALAVEWRVPPVMSRAWWNKLPRAAQEELREAVQEEIDRRLRSRSRDREGRRRSRSVRITRRDNPNTGFRADPRANTSGTSGIGDLRGVTAAQLTRTFGQPNPGDGDKTNYEWVLIDESTGDIVTIYDYEGFKWSVGSSRRGIFDTPESRTLLRRLKAQATRGAKKAAPAKKRARTKAPRKAPKRKRSRRDPARNINPVCDVGTEIQTVILDDRFFDESEARSWIRRHGFRASKLDRTSQSYRFRQVDPGEFLDGSFRTIRLRPGVEAVIGCPR